MLLTAYYLQLFIEKLKGIKMEKQEVKLERMVKELSLKSLTNIDYSERIISSQDINRPGIQLTGYFDHYDSNRVQIFGHVEIEYIKKLNDEERIKVYKKLLVPSVPCIVFCRNEKPDELFNEIAKANNIPVFGVDDNTTTFMSEIIRWLDKNFAPKITIHGCLVDVSGVGIFIKGESGIGKSEAVLELIRRGHRLVADDAVEIHKVNDRYLVGKATDITKDYLEIRGIGIVDIKSLYGFEAIKETQNIDVVVTLEEWGRDKEYDRLGIEEHFTEILDTKVHHYKIPVRPGRNIAVIIEACAVNYRQRKTGYNAVEVFLSRGKLS